MHISKVFPLSLTLISDKTNAQGAPVVLDTFDALKNLITASAYAPFTYRAHHRSAANFVLTSLLVLDYDNAPGDTPMSLDRATRVFAPYAHIIAPSRNHQKPKDDKPSADRFRVVLFLSTPITDAATYEATWNKVATMFEGCDRAAKDTARLYFPSLYVHSANDSGELISPASPPIQVGVRATGGGGGGLLGAPGVRGELSKATNKFMIFGAEKGFNNALYKAARDFRQKGYTEEEFVKAAERITGHLDHTDEGTIRSAYRGEMKYEGGEPANMPKVGAWLRAWLHDNGASYTYKSGRLKLNGEEYKLTLFLDEIFSANNLAAETDGRKPFHREDIKTEFARWKEQQHKAELATFKSSMMYDQGADSQVVERWVEAVCGTRDPLHIAVMRHFVWQVKRKLRGLKVVHHMMPILYGKTGSGKTEAIKALLSPAALVTNQPQDMTVLNDHSSAQLFAKNYIIFFDEMAKADAVVAGVLKSKISGDEIGHRVLYSHDHDVMDNNATFIGASNLHIQAVINDPTSARRFWQIETLDRTDWDTVNSLDYANVWKSVDEGAASPILPFLDQISHIQHESLRSREHVENWLADEMDIDLEGPGLTVNTAYESYVSWCNEQQMRSIMPRHTFTMKVAALGNKVPRKHTKHGRIYLLKFKNGTSSHLKTIR